MRRGGASIRRCFGDTSAFFALANTNDASHVYVRSLFQSLAARQVQLYSTNFILAETHALLLNRLNRDLARLFVREVERTTSIIRITPADEARAWEIIEQYRDKDFSLTDATSFAVMERMQIQYAFSLDRDFVQYGLLLLTPDVL